MRVERHLLSETEAARGERAVPDYAIRILLEACAEVEGEVQERVRDGLLSLDQAREVLSEALSRLQHPTVLYRLRRIERLAWRIGLTPWRFATELPHETSPPIRREATVLCLSGSSIAPPHGSTTEFPLYSIAGGEERQMFDYASPSDYPDPEVRRALPVGTILRYEAEKLGGSIGLVQIHEERVDGGALAPVGAAVGSRTTEEVPE
jgi:hypothetical protein